MAILLNLVKNNDKDGKDGKDRDEDDLYLYTIIDQRR